MRLLLATLALLLAHFFMSDAKAQAPTPPCVTTTNNSTGVGNPNCNVVTATNPLPVTGTLTVNPGGVTTTMTTAAPTATTFSSILAASSTRKACTIQNIGTTLGYVYFGSNASATTSNSFQVSANGGTISCNNVNGTVLQDNVSATCTSGTCAFIVANQ